MSYASVMVAMDPGRHARARARLAAGLAQRFGAQLIGVAACQPNYPRGYGETAVSSALVLEEIRKAALADIAGAEQAFRQASSRNASVGWRSGLADPVGFLEEQSRAADLIVVGRRGKDEGPDLGMAVDAGAALMGLGRPILVVPPGVGNVEARHVVIGWKNTLQTRRAVTDAIPLLKRAESVRVVAVTTTSEGDEVEDVAAYLGLHEIPAMPVRRRTPGVNVAEELRQAASCFGADLIVTGGYGHGRLREWAFGGVTRDLLGECQACCLMSH